MKRIKRFIFGLLGLCALAGGIRWALLHAPDNDLGLPATLGFIHRPRRFGRPYGMAPVAFRAYVRAACLAGVGPDRIIQTIGNYPASKGYHFRDGVLRADGRRLDYCAAVDLHIFGLKPAQVDKLVRTLATQGFAAWYRHEGSWEGNEHIHAVYAFLPMKWQLRDQVETFLRERRRRGLRPLRWEKKLRRQERHLRSYKTA